MPVERLDCSHEVSQRRPVSRTRAQWLAGDIRDADWRVELTPSALAEIDQLAAYIDANPVELMQRRVADVDIPHCRDATGQLLGIISNGVGFAVLDRLPVDRYSLQSMIEIYWLLGQLIGRPVAQKYIGQMIYHVHDSGKAFQYGVRGSHTNIELNFHTDNAFGRMVPDSVGLFCHRAAKSGGISRFCSLYTVHERIAQVSSVALDRLYQPMLFDRQKEHGAADAPVTWEPFFSWRGDKLYARANPSLVRKGYEVAGETVDDQLLEALNIVDAVSSEPDLWFESALEPGQIQYLNNHEIGHYRSEFEDYEVADQKRSLYRLWHRNEGATSYHGELG
ncbi:MAG: TauD/TfdA family dioxygenase [Burkholderiaceae bacterium]